jgi:hypothetical protein
MSVPLVLPTHFSTSELAGLLGISRQALFKRARVRNWEKASNLRKGQGGGFVWPVDGLDEESRQRALSEYAKRQNKERQRPMTEDETAYEQQRLDCMAEQFARKTEKARERACRRLQLLLEAIELVEGGMGIIKAFRLTAKNNNVHWSNLRNWYYGTDKKLGVKDLPRREWLYALQDHYVGRRPCAEWTEEAKEFFFSLYLHQRAPDASECIRRMFEAAELHNWTCPNQRTIYREIKKRGTGILRDYLRGKDKDFRNIMPPQERDHTCFQAGEATVYDATPLDLYAIFEDGELVEKPALLAGQDIYSGKLIAWRLGKTETADLYRLTIFDQLGHHTPQHIWTDNTRAAANKLITGNGSNRHRFLNKEGDSLGLLQHAGIKHHFTSPNHEMSSPGAKPVERAFGIGGIHNLILNNPRIRDLGTKGKPVPVVLLREVIAEEIARFNSREGRRGKHMQGRSFDQIFAESFSQANRVNVSHFTRDLFLLNREEATVQSNGLITINAGRGQEKNRYWSQKSSEYAKQRVLVYYDPDNLTKDICFSHLNGSFIGRAQYQPSKAFMDKEAGKEYAKARASILKAEKKKAAAEVTMDTLEIQKLTKKIEAAEMPKPATSHTAFGNPEINKMMSESVKKDFSSLYANRDRKLASM